MDPFDILLERLAKIERAPRVALACQCAVRAQPVYDACWIGDHDPVYAEAVELAWRHAEGGGPDPAAISRIEAALRALLDFYYDEEYQLMANVVTVALRAIQALDEEEAASALAVARALTSCRAVADGAEAEARPPRSREPEEADAEEKAWQVAAIDIAEAWHGPASRDMFDAIPPEGPPRWLQALLASKR